MSQANEGEEAVITQEGWDAVAAEKAGETPPETPAVLETPEEPAPQEVAPVAEAPVETPPADPMESLPPAVREKLAKLDALEQTLLRQTNDMKSAIGRIGSIQSELDAAKRAAGAKAPTQAQVEAASKNPEKWEAMKADFPDWGDAIDELLNHRLAGLQPGSAAIDPTQVDSIVAQRVEASRAELRKEIEEYKVELKHGEDWKDKINTSDFANWFAAQDATTKMLAESPRGSDAVKLLDKFEQARAKPVEEVKTERTSRLQAAATTRPGQAPPPKTEEDLSPEELWNYMAKKRAA